MLYSQANTPTIPALKITLLVLIICGSFPIQLTAADNSTSEFIRQFNTANDYYQGVDRQRDYGQALKWYAKVIEFDPGKDKSKLMLALRQKSIAYERLAYMFNHGHGTSINQPQALKLYKRGLILYQQLQIYSGSYSEYQQSIRDIKNEISTLENSLTMKVSSSNNYTFDLSTITQQARFGNVEAQNELGDYYYGTNYKFVNMPEAIKWYQKAAAQNHSSAIFSLGYIYELGKGVSADKDKGESYFLKLGSKNQISEIILAHLYETGRGREKNLDYALELYKKLPVEIAGGDVIRVQRKLSNGSAIFGEAIAYRQDQIILPSQQESLRDRVYDIIEDKKKNIPYLVLGMLAVFVTIKFKGKASRLSGGVKNQTVSAARILIEVGDYSAARDMLLEYLQENPSDDQARELLQQTVRIH